MSWLFSQALVAAYSEAISSDGEPSAPLSGSPTQLAYLPPDRMTAFSRPSRSGMTFRPLTADLGAAVLTSYLADFPVRTSALPAKAQESPEIAAECGDTWRGSLARFDPATSSWRTAQPSLLEDLGESSVTWPRSGMTAGGQCWELPMLGRRTSGIGSGWWQETWPTPRCHMTRPVRVRLDVEKGHKSNLEEVVAVRATWPTPTVCGNYNRAGLTKKSGDGLATAVLKCATPTARDWRSGKASQATMERNSRPLSEQIGGSLNPDWVEWLMNWPITWSSLNAVNRKEFQRWQEASATALQESGQLRTMWWDRDPSQAPSGQHPGEQPEQELGDSLQQVPRNAARQPEVEGSHEGSDLPLLRDSLHLQAGEGENVQQGMREQAVLDEAQIVSRVASGVAARVDRLKAIGNGQVPLCAATAWQLLTA